MKKSSLFKILTLFLTFVIFSCCSGCFVESCIGSCMDKQREKEKAEFLERARAKKAEADSFIPQVDDYILELKPKTYFENEGKAIEAGYFYPTQKIWNKDEWFLGVYFPPPYESVELSLYPYDTSKKAYDFKCDVTDIYGFEFFFPHKDIGGLFHKDLIEYDGKFFAIHCAGEVFLYGRDNFFIPPALYLIDVENEQIFYCGYFEQWYDDVFNNYRGRASGNYCYKITKKVGEKNEEI